MEKMKDIAEASNREWILIRERLPATPSRTGKELLKKGLLRSDVEIKLRSSLGSKLKLVELFKK